jgi:hypothetical protein
MSNESPTPHRESCLLHLTKPDVRFLAEIGRLRIIAWEASGPRPRMAPKVGDKWLDSHEGHAHHWAIQEQGRIVAAARMCLHTSLNDLPDYEDLIDCEHEFLWPVASINRLVIHPGCRHRGWSVHFDSARLILAQQLAARCVAACTHSEGRIRGLSDLGFVVIGQSLQRAVPLSATAVLMKVLKQ